MYSICAIGGRLLPDDPIAFRAEMIGHICQYVSRFDKLSRRPIGPFLKQLMHAQAVDQLRVYLNPYGHCVGYVAWAFLTPDVEKEFLSGKCRQLAEWEYNDGTSAWILDMVVSHGTLAYVLDDLRDTVFRRHKQLTYFRVKGDRRIFKRLHRSSTSNFLRRGNVGLAQ